MVVYSAWLCVRELTNSTIGPFITLAKLIFLLKEFPALTHNPHISFVITGNRPDPDYFLLYPDFIWFDGVLSRPHTKFQLSRIKMLSDDFKHYSQWNGDGQIP